MSIQGIGSVHCSKVFKSIEKRSGIVELHYIFGIHVNNKRVTISVMFQLPIELNYWKSCANYRRIVYTYGRRINLQKEGRRRSIEAHPPEFDFAHFLDSEAL